MSEFAQKERPPQSCSKNCSTANRQEKLLPVRSLLPDQKSDKVKHGYGKGAGQPGLSSIQYSAVHSENASLIKPPSPPASGEKSNQELALHSEAKNTLASFGMLNDSHASSLPDVHFGHDFNRVKIYASRRAMPSAGLTTSGLIQAKLAVSQPDDESEKEADRVAEQVMGMSCLKSANGTGWSPFLCNQRYCQNLDSKQPIITAKTIPDQNTIVSKGTKGYPSAVPYRDEMEQRFGIDFRHVKAYLQDNANAAARSLGSEAFTVGNNIVFASDNPNKSVVAHELTHIIQQSVHGENNKSPNIQSSSENSNGCEALKPARAVDNGYPTPLPRIKARTNTIYRVIRRFERITGENISDGIRITIPVTPGTNIDNIFDDILDTLGADIIRARVPALMQRWQEEHPEGRNLMQSLVAHARESGARILEFDVIYGRFQGGAVDSITINIPETLYISSADLSGDTGLIPEPEYETPPMPDPSRNPELTQMPQISVPRGGIRRPSRNPELSISSPLDPQQVLDWYFNLLGGRNSGYSIRVCDSSTRVEGAESYTNIGIFVDLEGGAFTDPESHTIWVHADIIRSGGKTRIWGGRLNVKQVIAHELGHAYSETTCSVASQVGSTLPGLTDTERQEMRIDAIMIAQRNSYERESYRQATGEEPEEAERREIRVSETEPETNPSSESAQPRPEAERRQESVMEAGETSATAMQVPARELQRPRTGPFLRPSRPVSFAGASIGGLFTMVHDYLALMASQRELILGGLSNYQRAFFGRIGGERREALYEEGSNITYLPPRPEIFRIWMNSNIQSWRQFEDFLDEAWIAGLEIIDERYGFVMGEFFYDALDPVIRETIQRLEEAERQAIAQRRQAGHREVFFRSDIPQSDRQVMRRRLQGVRSFAEPLAEGTDLPVNARFFELGETRALRLGGLLSNYYEVAGANLETVQALRGQRGLVLVESVESSP